MRIALLVFPLDRTPSTTTDHIYALRRYLYGEVTVCAVRRGEIPIDLRKFDVVIIHHSAIIYPYRNSQVGFSEDSIQALRNFAGIKLAFAQDEYRSVIERRKFFNDIELDHLFSLADPSGYDLIYSSKTKRSYTISTVLPGYVTDQMREWNSASFLKRHTDIGYRGRVLPRWMGSVSSKKFEIVETIQKEIRLKKMSVTTNLSVREEDRLYGNSWKEFLNSTKSQIATGSGASILDLDGRYVDSIFGPPRILIKPIEPIVFRYHMMSPRILDYAASGNIIIKIQGHQYDGIVHDENSLTLYEDASNLPDVLKDLKSEDKYESIINYNNEKILFNDDYHFAKLASEVNNQIEKCLAENETEIQKPSVRLYAIMAKKEFAPFLLKSNSLNNRILVGFLFYFFKLLKMLRF